MTGQMRFGKQTQAGDSTGTGKLVPTGIGDRMERHAVNQAVKKVRELGLIS